MPEHPWSDVSLNSVFSGLHPMVLYKHVIYPTVIELKLESNRSTALQYQFKLAKYKNPTSPCSPAVSRERIQLDCAPILEPQLFWALALPLGQHPGSSGALDFQP